MSSTPILEASGITKTFGGIAALHDVSISVVDGEAVGIVGPNGAGKTTLFDCLLGVLRPDDGSVRFEGRDVTALPVHRRARLGIGRTFQRLEVFPELTPREHVLVAERVRRGVVGVWRDLLGLDRRNDAERTRVEEILDLVGLTDLADTPVEALGLGFGRLVELARALASDPTLLLLDEPSSGLDRSETRMLAQVIGGVRERLGTAVVLVEHDLDLVVQTTERMYVLDSGMVIAEGEPTTVMTDPAVRQAYLGDVA